MSLLVHVVGLVRRSGDDADAAALTAFYMGMAIGARDPAAGRRLLAQMEREMAGTHGQPAETIETYLRAGAETIAAFLEHTVEEPA